MFNKHKMNIHKALTIDIKELSEILETKNIYKIEEFFSRKIEQQLQKKANKEKKKLKAAENLAIIKERRNDFLKDKANEFRADLIKNQTQSEMQFKIVLKELGITYEFQKIFFYKKSFYIVDFYLPSHGVALEIDGGYHNTKEQKLKDKIRSRDLKIIGIKNIIRFKNEDVTDPFKREFVNKKLKGYEKIY